MAQTHLLLAGPVYVANSSTVVYTVGASKKAYIKKIRLHNTNSSTENVTVSIKPSGGSAFVVLAVGLLTTETLKDEDSHPTPLAVGDAIYAGTTTASKVTIIITGMEEDV